MRFRLFGTEIYVSFLFMAVISIMLATDKTGMALPTLFAVFSHEIGHLFCMWLIDCAPKRIKLIPTSVQITASFSKRYQNDILIALCGPLVNYLLFFTLYFNYLTFKNQITLYYALINLIIGSFNMLPVCGLDGGTILFSILAKRLQLNRANFILKAVTFFIGLLALIGAIYLTVQGKTNLSLYIMVLYLIIMSIIKM